MDYRRQKILKGLLEQSAMTKCFFCNNQTLQRYKKLKGATIYICRNCDVSIVKKRKNKVREVLYNFETYDKNSERLKNNFQKLAEEIHKIKSSGSVLDIGGGFGLLSSLLLALGRYKLEVLEPEVKPYYLKDKKYTLYKKSIENFLKKKSAKKYDLILMFDVIEHIVSPLEVLKKLRNKLSKDGVIIIQTPNYKSLMQYMVTDWSWWMIEDHKFLFSARSFTYYMDKVGLRIEYLKTYERWYDFKKNLDGNFMQIKNKYVRKFYKVLFFSLFFPFYFIFREGIWRVGYGGLLFAVLENKLPSYK